METALSILTLAGFLWVLAFLLPKALEEKDVFALVCALLTAILVFLMWFFVGGTRVS